METNNDIALYSGVNRSTRTQVGVMIWIHKSIKNTVINCTVINCTYWSESIIEVKQYLKKEIIIFGLYVRKEGNNEESEKNYNIIQKILNRSS
jgi:hypothetical protein